jgi:hypothetical protein
VSNKDTIIEALTMQLKIEREGNLALAKREWVGLTDEELDLLWLDHHGNNTLADGRILSFERAVEAKLKEKNNG